MNTPVKKAVVTIEDSKKLEQSSEVIKRTMAVEALEIKKGKEFSVKLEF